MSSVSSSSQRQLEKALFLEADEIGEKEARDVFLRERCGDDQSMYERLCKLFESVEEEDDLLDPGRFDRLETARQAVSQHLAEEDRFLDRLGSSIGYVGDYELVEEIGRGAMGVVFHARQTSLNRAVALKLILGQSLASEADRQRFRIEAEAAANVSHPNIVPVYEIGHHEGHDYFSMPLITGGTLTNHMNAFHKDSRRGVALMVKVVEAVQAAHERGILHRDLKPDNILLDEEGEPHVSDFGLASRFGEESGLTLTGQIMGTPQYMAPEQAEGGGAPVTIAADVYSLGSILYEMLAGEPVFKSDSVMGVLRMVKEEVPKPLRSHHSHIDLDLETIALKCLEKEPARRYGSARALRRDLVAWFEHRPIEARPPTKAERLRKWVRRRPLHAALLGMATLLIVALGVGGPLVAWKQSTLREEADAQRFAAEAQGRLADARRDEANRERNKALEASQLADQRAEENRGMVYRSNMVMGGLALSAPGIFPSLAPLLEQWYPADGLPDLRAWEWHYLNASIDQSTYSLYHEAKDKVSVAFDPAGIRLATWHFRSEEIKLWDVATGELLERIKPGFGLIDVAWHPLGSRLAFSYQSHVALWDLASKETILTKRVSPKSVRQPFPHLDWSPNGNRLACVSGEGTVYLLNGETLETVGSVEILAQNGDHFGVKSRDPFHFFSELTWSPNGEYLALAGYPTTVTKYVYVKAVNRPEEATHILEGHDAGVMMLEWSPDSRWLASASRDRTLKLWETKTWSTTRTIDAHDAWVNAIAWHPHGDRLASASANREINVWDANTGAFIERHWGHREAVESLDWSHDGNVLASGDAGGHFKLWHADTLKSSRILYRHSSGIESVSFDPSGTRIACIADDAKCFIINATTGKPEDLDRFDTEEGGGEMPVLWTRHGLVLRRSPDGFHLVDPDTGKRTRSVTDTTRGSVAPVTSSYFRADDNLLVTANYQRQVMVFDLSQTDEARVLSGYDASDGPRLLSVAIDPTGTYVSATGRSGHVMLWDLETGEEQFRRDEEIAPTSDIHDHEWHPEGRYFASGSSEYHVVLWDSEDLERPELLQGHTSEVRTVAWHPDGKRLASGSWDGTIKIWDAEARELALTLRGHTNVVTWVTWSPDGRTLVSSSRDGTVRMWDASRGYEANQ